MGAIHDGLQHSGGMTSLILPVSLPAIAALPCWIHGERAG
jgi:hypothetical protein